MKTSDRTRTPFFLTSALAGCLLLGLLLTLAACDGGNDHPEPAATEQAGTAPDAGAATGSAAGGAAPSPSGPAALSSRGTPATGPMPSGPERAGITYDLPASWQSETPGSQMRLDQAAIPGPGGPGQLTVFFFGPGGGGGVDANIDRWIAQMDATGSPQRESFDSNGLKVTWVDVEGTLLPSNMGMGPSEPQPGSRLLGAVVEGPGGPWFFKATGPSQTLEAERDSFLDLLRSVRRV